MLIVSGNLGMDDTILIDVNDGKLTAEVKGQVIAAG